MGIMEKQMDKKRQNKHDVNTGPMSAFKGVSVNIQVAKGWT